MFNYLLEHVFILHKSAYISCSFSSTDGSDWQQTDVEDQRSEQANTSQTGQTKDLQQGNPGNPMLKTAGRELQPIYIINNMVLKKVRQVYLAHTGWVDRPEGWNV